jgi:serine/threonine-protein kinase
MAVGTEPTSIGEGVVLGERYRLEARIATGGMATVWRGEDLQLGRAVAVKVLAEGLADDPAFAARFRREAQLAGRLTHPNLVRVFDFGQVAGRPYMVMEYVPGATLADRIALGTARDMDQERLAADLLTALAQIHGAGIVHRDVKPSNVLFDEDGRARLGDLGIAQPEDATRLTLTGNVIGTLRYMAPEVADGQPATAESDLYSAGVVLAEASGRGSTRAVRRLIDHLTRTEPARRPASAEAALELLSGTPRRQIEITAGGLLAGLAAIAAAIAIVAIALGSGSSSKSPPMRAGHTTPTRESTTTATVTQSAPIVPPTPPPPKPEAKPKPPGPEKMPPGQEKKAEEGD